METAAGSLVTRGLYAGADPAVSTSCCNGLWRLKCMGPNNGFKIEAKVERASG